MTSSSFFLPSSSFFTFSYPSIMMVRRTLTRTQLTETAKKKNMTAAIVLVSCVRETLIFDGVKP